MKQDTKQEFVEITKEKLLSIKLLDSNNKVLLRTCVDNESQRTDSGILINPRTHLQGRGDHANRVFEVIKVPKKLNYLGGYENVMKSNGAFVRSFKKDIEQQKYNTFTYPDWKTEIEIKPKDIVITSKRITYNCMTFICEGEEYKLIDYHSIYMAIRGKKVIPLNGYLICEEVVDGVISDLIWTPDQDKSVPYGKVAYVGKPNDEYYTDMYSDGSANEIKKGDIVMKRKAEIHLDLENEMHAYFDKTKKYFVIQRRDVLGVLEGVKTTKLGKRLKVVK